MYIRKSGTLLPKQLAPIELQCTLFPGDKMPNYLMFKEQAHMHAAEYPNHFKALQLFCVRQIKQFL